MSWVLSPSLGGPDAASLPMLPRYPRRAARPQASRRAPCLAKPAHMQTHRGAAAGAMASRYLAVLLITFQLSEESRRRKEPETANVITQTDDHAAARSQRLVRTSPAGSHLYAANGANLREDAKQ